MNHRQRDHIRALDRSRNKEAELKNMLRLVLDAIPVRVFWKDRDLAYLGCNELFARDAGLDSAEAIKGMRDSDMPWTDQAELYNADDRAVMASGRERLNFEEVQSSSGGRKIWLNTSKIPLLDGEGHITGLLGTYEDITERKEAEEILNDYAQRLERSNHELEQFASIASHDLQEPLRKVQAFGDRLKTSCGEGLGDKGRDYLDRILNAAGRMRNLIDELLTYSRVTTKAKPFAPVDLEGILSEVSSDLEVRIHELDARIEADPLPVIEADAVQMRQLFQNLLGNALKFHRDDVAPRIRIRAEDLAEKDPFAPLVRHYCRITVEDNGIGFETKYADRIFGVFQRLHGRGTYAGTGMGLAICQKIVDRHQGRIRAEGDPGTGARFIVSLPKKPLDGGTE